MSGSYGANTQYTNHSWIEDGSLAEQSPDWGRWGRTTSYFEYWYDSIREDEYIVDKNIYHEGNVVIYLKIRRKDGSLSYTTLTSALYSQDCWYNTYRLVFDAAGGFWIYYYLHRSSSGIDGGNYYLRYYDGGMNLIYNKQATSAQGTFLYDMDSVYESNGDMWYIDRDFSTVFKIDRDGAILTSYIATQGLTGVVAVNDGGCWFIQDDNLTRLNSDGEIIDVIELPTFTSTYVYSDFDGGFWIQDGWIIRHLDSVGNELFNVEIVNLYHITPAYDGVLVKHHDGSISTIPKASFISKDHQRITRTWDYPRTEGSHKGTFDYNRYGVRSHTYDDLVDDHASHFPIAIDSQWNTFSEWTKVSLRDYNFTNEKYHQIRFTLRADNSNSSPEVYGSWTQRAIEIPNIYPGNYGRFYLKSDINSLTPQDAGDYNSNVRAYWFLDTE